MRRSHINGNLYHYAGNNPVCYTDPTGMFEVDEETKKITADIDDKKDIKKAVKFYSKHKDYAFEAMNKNGDGIKLGNYEAAKNYSKMINSNDGLPINDIISMLGDTTFIISETTKKIVPDVATNIGKLSSVLSLISTAEDLKNCKKDPNFENKMNLLIDVIGLIPGGGSYFALGLKLTSLAMEKPCSIFAKMTYYTNLYLQDYYEESMLEAYGE